MFNLSHCYYRETCHWGISGKGNQSPNDVHCVLRDAVGLNDKCIKQWFSNGDPQEVARCSANIMKVSFKNERKPICLEIFIHSLKYINMLLILYTKCARKLLYVLQCAANQKGLRTAGIK
jgi:hypothetical protein